jgi:hypothetical protein
VETNGGFIDIKLSTGANNAGDLTVILEDKISSAGFSVTHQFIKEKNTLDVITIPIKASIMARIIYQARSDPAMQSGITVSWELDVIGGGESDNNEISEKQMILIVLFTVLAFALIACLCTCVHRVAVVRQRI